MCKSGDSLNSLVFLSENHNILMHLIILRINCSGDSIRYFLFKSQEGFRVFADWQTCDPCTGEGAILFIKVIENRDYIGEVRVDHYETRW